MIPLGDVDRRPRNFPVVTVILIAVNVVVFLIELTGTEDSIVRWAFVPAHILAGRDLYTIFTAMFLHASWIHIIGNMVFLWAFGPEIEDTMGSIRYLIFYLLGGCAAAAAQIAVSPASTVPSLGASGAIAAVMGAFIVTYPRDRIRTVFVIFVFVQVAYIPSVILIGIWFLTQLFSQVGARVTTQTGGVAYMAHVGGFIFGTIFARLFEKKKRPEIAA